MAQTETTSIAIQPELLSATERYAQAANKSVETVVDEALRFYITDTTAGFNDKRRLHKERATELGLEMDDYIARLIKDWRLEDREREADDARRS